MVSFRSDWEALYAQLATVIQDLDKVSKHRSPISFLEDIKTKTQLLNTNLRKQNLSMIGGVNFSKSLLRVTNCIEGLQYAIRTNDLENDRLNKILINAKGSLMPAIEEIKSKLQRQDLEKLVQSAQIDQPVSEDKYNTFTDAMQTLMRQAQHDGPEKTDSDKSNSRDLVHMSEIMKRNNEDLVSLRAQLNKATLDKFSDENFHLVTGPVLIGAALDVIKLKAAGIDFDTVYFPGIRYGFARKEETPRFYILRNQMLIAVLDRKKGRFHMNLKGKTPIQKGADEKTRFKQISADVVSLLEAKTGERYMQIGAEREKYITNKQFSGTRFMLLMKRSVFERIGPFGSSNTLELPF